MDDETTDGATTPTDLIPADGEPTDDVALVRAFVLAGDPDLVPELVAGGSVPEVLASVAAARAAYARVADRLRTASPTAAAGDASGVPGAASRPAVPVVPAGGAAAFVVDPATLPAGELIRRGVSAARRE